MANQLISPHFGSKEDVTNPTLNPSMKGQNTGIKYPSDLEQRTKSPNAQDEKIYEPAKGGNASKP